MPTIAAVVLTDPRGRRFAGLDVNERAAVVARRAGINHVHYVGHAMPSRGTRHRLRGLGLKVTGTRGSERPLASAPRVDRVLLLPATTVLQPAALKAFLRAAEPEAAAVLVDQGASRQGGHAVLVDASRRGEVHDAKTMFDVVTRLMRTSHLRAITVSPYYCAALPDDRDIAPLEREYLRVTNGGSTEGLFTRSIRVFSVPLSLRLLRYPITPNQVTIIGFALSVAAGCLFALGAYDAGVAGALLYFASMVLDCSDGEVARAKLADSPFGAWLETVTDYLSYFVVLGGIVWGDVAREGFCSHAMAAVIAASASLGVVALVGYQRARVARANPGAFDDALAAQLRTGTLVQRFAVWGRQLIKRSFVAHLILFQALIGHLPALTKIWAIGAVAALVVVLSIHAHLIRSVRVEPLGSSAA
jgi:phosphatidylglycerophosphate synthase